jgi:hypothetical protein
MRNIIAISIVATSILAYNLWPLFDCFYIGIALCFFLSALALVLKSERETIERRIYFILFFLTFNNLLDELFFDPKRFGANEYFIAAFIIAHQVYLQRNKDAKREQ